MPILSEPQLAAIKLGFKILFYCLLIGGPATVVWFERNDHWNGVIEKQQAEAETTLNSVANGLSETIRKLGDQRNEDLATIDQLRHNPVRVQLPCQAGDSPAPQTGGSGLSIAGTNSTPKNPQQAFDDFTADLADDAAEWGKALAACKVMQNYIKSLP